MVGKYDHRPPATGHRPLTTGSAMAENRIKITLACTQCESRNYNTTKNRQKHPERVEYKKYCVRCGKHTKHKETK